MEHNGITAGTIIFEWTPMANLGMLDKIAQISDCAKILTYDGTVEDLMNRIAIYNAISEKRRNVNIVRKYGPYKQLEKIYAISDRDIYPGETLAIRRPIVEWLHPLWTDETRSVTARAVLRHVIEVFASDSAEEKATMERMDHVMAVPISRREY